MSKPMIRIHNTEIDEVIDREMTDAEFAQYEANNATEAIKQAELQTRNAAKTALLKKLGITQEEADLLLA